MKGAVKECVVLKGNAEELNKTVKDGVMKNNACDDGLNLCNIQYVWEIRVTNPNKKNKKYVGKTF